VLQDTKGVISRKDLPIVETIKEHYMLLKGLVTVFY